ncbi:MAG: threonine synthase [Dehalococcoidia bacterium]|nr:threonine synthase [Dehalococcoidia bacterium]
MAHVLSLRCRECSREYPVEPLNVCEFCFGPLEVVYDYETINRVVSRERIEAGPRSMWRYADFLPADYNPRTDINAGFTPLIRSRNLAEELGLNELYIKNDSVNPSYSFKDRVVAVASAKALEFGFKTIACASTGNLAGAVAAHAARAGMEAYVFIPADLEAGKVLGAAIYDAAIVAVDGSYDDVNRLCSELADRYPWAFVNINVRPFYADGSKTLGYEAAEQLGWRAPAHAVAPAASGAMFTKIWKGLNEFADVGLIDGPVETRMHLAQAAGCAPIAEAYADGRLIIKPVKPNSVAKSLAIGNPADGYYALKTIEASQGSAVIVAEHEVAEGAKLLARTEGIFTEAAGGVAVSALKRLAESGAIGRDESTVVYITGNGLKTVELVQDVVRPIHISASVDAFEAAVDARVS